MPAKSRLLVVCSAGVVASIVLAFVQRVGPHAAAAPRAGGQTFSVNSTVDAPDADLGDGICASAANGCTLRAAID